jgi:hypothetical protein
MKIIEHRKEIELLKLYKMDSAIRRNFFMYFAMKTYENRTSVFDVYIVCQQCKYNIYIASFYLYDIHLSMDL